MSSLSPLSLLGIGYAAAAAVMVGLWTLQRRTQDATVVDIGWGAIVATLAISYGWFFPGAPLRRLLASTLGGFWGYRLAWHLLRHRWGGTHGEDGRYQNMRSAMGDRAQLGFFIFFQIQAFAAVLCSLPYAAIAVDWNPELTALDLLGLSLWCVSMIGESIADNQLATFRAAAENRGKTCRVGLWRYSRHPNYFFEWLHWWGYVALTVHTPFLPLTLCMPPLMLLLLLRFSGVPHTEAQALRSRGEDYRRYQQETNVFIPWFPCISRGGD